MTFKREERLKSEKIITQLFRKGHSFACYPLRLVYAEIPTEIPPLSITADFDVLEAFETPQNKDTTTSPKPSSPIQFALSVPKKAFKRAVDRNVLRRRIREAYRLHKIDLYRFLENTPSQADKRFAFMVLYTAKEDMPYSEIEKGVKKMIRKFKAEFQ
ncbi:MAG: ribonuclease P protein component [Saprospiraceae bacterium]|nr:ribonuclease P protein component [Saprospiraceae bacterium]